MVYLPQGTSRFGLYRLQEFELIIQDYLNVWNWTIL